jgi:hypothetical protein
MPGAYDCTYRKDWWKKHPKKLLMKVPEFLAGNAPPIEA